jgi:multidrug efflux pump subunit AcrA (membrane-fusion protein)
LQKEVSIKKPLEWLFVVNGNKAVRRNIKLGRENPSYYEVLEGLKQGEKVIIMPTIKK